MNETRYSNLIAYGLVIGLVIGLILDMYQINVFGELVKARPDNQTFARKFFLCLTNFVFFDRLQIVEFFQ